MTNFSRILPVPTLLITVAMMVGCGGPAAADIDATVEARVEAARPGPTSNVDATVEARVQATQDTSTQSTWSW